MLVGFYEVLSKYGGEEFDRDDWVLFGEDIGCLFLGVCCNDDRVVGLGIAAVC